MAGAKHPRFYLGPVVSFPVVILFNYNKRNCLYLLIGGKPLTALIANPAPSDGIVILGRP